MTIVYHDPAMYAGWPANHGAWQWGDHFLVGFMRGPYHEANSMHHIGQPFERMLARSRNGGKTWRIEHPMTAEPGPAFQCKAAYLEPRSLMPPNSITASIMRVCGVYDHGGDYTDEYGGFYLSGDYGQYWHGPYKFSGLESTWGENLICTSRTRVIDNLFFMSAGQRDIWGTDFTFCAQYVGGKFEVRSIVLDDEARAVMPAVARVGKSRTVVCMRRRKSGRRQGWIDAVYSDDNCKTWSKPVFVGATGGRNGNPPALLTIPGHRLLCCFGNRDEGSMCYAVSEDGGETWPNMGTIATGGAEDIGYPQLFLRSDGIPICVYYWADAERPQQHIVATEVKV